MSFPEILAPVGNAEMLSAAVRSGADAIYLGLGDFNARRGAENFDGDGFVSAVDYCRINGVKVYVTLNTAVTDGELSAALKAAATAYDAGADALIVADIGLADTIHKYLPDFPLHASTQMTVHSPEALSFLKAHGFSRVVLAREMSRDEIRAVCEEARRLSMSVEVFVHGALCMCVSGQCYLSAVLGSRSGNRGLCAGPCRLPFAAENGTGYDLSLKDLSLFGFLDELAKTGVDSFKIEGRMKRPEYVAAAVTAARKSRDGENSSALSDTLKSVFSRSGFTDGYYTGKTGKNMFGIRTKEDVAAAGSVYPQLHELYRTERQHVGLDASVKIKNGEDVSFTLCDGEHTVTASLPPAEAAQSKPLDTDKIREALSKLGSTPYFIKNFTSDIDGGLFLRVSALNDLRRDAVEKLNAARILRRKSDISDFSVAGERIPRAKNGYILRLDSAEQLPGVLSNVYGVSLPLERLSELPDGIIKIADIPRFYPDGKKLLSALEKARLLGYTHAFCGNAAHFGLCREAGLIPIAGLGLNIFNSAAAMVYEDEGAAITVPSFELKFSDINRLGAKKTAVISYGRLPLMIFKNCPIKNGKSCKNCGRKSFLTDRLGTRFPVLCREGVSELINSRPLILSDRQNEINADFEILYFTTESKDEVESVLDMYESSRPPEGEFTRGLYNKGVM